MSELIAVCYRMSDVVSPVVQSSSPEGLIPMDTDSGKQIQPGRHSLGLMQEHFHILILTLMLYSVRSFAFVFQDSPNNEQNSFELDECHLFMSR